MDNRSLSLAETLVAAPYIRAGTEALQATHSVVHSIIAQRRCPERGMSDTAIELLLHQLAMMDTNNFAAHVGAGEREGRVAVSLVARRHYGFTHGIGRSGDVTRDQPKAAGSSLLYKITNYMILDLLRLAGTPSLQEAVVVPMATGMTLALLLRSIAQHRQASMQIVRNINSSSSEEEEREKEDYDEDEESINTYDMEVVVHHTHSGNHNNMEKKKVVNGNNNNINNNSSEECEPRYVIWTRIDQKTALKCIEAAGLLSLPVPLRHASWQKSGRNSHRNGKSKNNYTHRERKNDKMSFHPYFLQSHVDDIAAVIGRIGGPRAVICVLTTTSCFAPRLPDDVLAIARLCKVLNVPHVVNNAYGVQSRSIMQRLDAAIRLGRVDAIVQSGDKNFLVPVGGAVISGKAEVVARAAALYAGRASASPIMDIFITALSLGRSGFQQLWKGRYKLRKMFEAALQKFACARGEELLAEQMGDTYNNNKVADTNTPRNNTPTVAVDAAAASAAAAVMNTTITTMNNTINTTNNTTITTDTMPEITVPPRNDISFAITMRTVGGVEAAKAIGARLFRSAVTGPRVVVPDSSETRLCGHVFRNYGMHTDETPPCPMLVMACGIGMTETDLNGVMERLEKVWPVNNGKITTRKGGEGGGLKKSRSRSGRQGRSHLK